MRSEYTDVNAKSVDQWVSEGWTWGQPISPEAFARAKAGEIKLLLTPARFVPETWYPPLRGARVLGLACGGAQQMPVFAAHGAVCTVLDYSEKQLESERMVSQREGYDIDIVRADMTKPLPFADDSFDLIFHPVSNCYVEEVLPIWRECFRVLKRGGVLLAGLDNGANFLFEEDKLPLVVTNALPYNPLKLPRERLDAMIAHGDGVQFSHTLEEQLGGQLEAGLRLTHILEDRDTEGAIRDFMPQFIMSRAVKA